MPATETPRVLKGPRVVVVTSAELERRADADAGRRQAELAEAYRAGEAAARAAGLGAVPQLVAALDRASAALASELRARRAEDAGRLLDAAGELARWLVGRELALDPAAFAATLDRLVEELPAAGGLVVHVNPELVAVVEQRWAPARGATVVGDPALAPGEARLGSGSGDVRLCFDEALALARRVLEGDDR